MYSFRKDQKRSFIPRCPVSNADQTTAIWSVAPRTSTTNINLLNYGISYLFLKPGATASTYSLRGVITLDI